MVNSLRQETFSNQNTVELTCAFDVLCCPLMPIVTKTNLKKLIH